MNFSFYADSYKFIAVLASISMLGFVLSLHGLIAAKLTAFQIFIKASDLITIAVPPALPACLTIGLSFAIVRIKAKSIYCISPPRINVSGKLSYICFDKTGTLTEDFFLFDGIEPITEGNEKKFDHYIKVTDRLPNLMYGESQPLANLIEAMGLCHSLAMEGEICKNAKLIGDPLEQELFAATRWKFRKFSPDGTAEINSQDDDTSYGGTILKRFPFNSDVKRMSVIVKMNNGKLKLITKGAPDIMKRILLEKNRPRNYDQELEEEQSKDCDLWQ